MSNRLHTIYTKETNSHAFVNIKNFNESHFFFLFYIPRMLWYYSFSILRTVPAVSRMPVELAACEVDLLASWYGLSLHSTIWIQGVSKSWPCTIQQFMYSALILLMWSRFLKGRILVTTTAFGTSPEPFVIIRIMRIICTFLELCLASSSAFSLNFWMLKLVSVSFKFAFQSEHILLRHFKSSSGNSCNKLLMIHQSTHMIINNGSY